VIENRIWEPSNCQYQFLTTAVRQFYNITVKPPYLIIDGYNLMHAAGIARSKYGPGDLERCRTQLRLHLQGLLASSVLLRTTVVYDAFESISDDFRHFNEGGLKIIFAPKGTDADTEIELLLQTHNSPRQVLIVSSDHRLHNAAKRRKARCIDSEEFLEEIGHDEDSLKPRRMKRLPDTPLPKAPPRAKNGRADPIITSEGFTEQLANDPELAELTRKLETPPVKDHPKPQENATSPFDESYLQDLERDLGKGRL